MQNVTHTNGVEEVAATPSQYDAPGDKSFTLLTPTRSVRISIHTEQPKHEAMAVEFSHGVRLGSKWFANEAKARAWAMSQLAK